MLATFNKMSNHLERNDSRRFLSRMIQFYKRVFEEGGLHQYAKGAKQLKDDRWITDTYLHTVSELALIESNDEAISDGSVLNYRIYVDNNCPDMHSSNASALYNLVIKDELSPGLEFKPLRVRTSSNDIKLTSVSKNKSIWTLPKLEYGRSHWIDYQVKVNTNNSQSEYINLVKVSGFDSQRIYCISEDEHQVEMSKEFIKFRVNTFIDENRNGIANSSEKSVSRVSVFVNGRLAGYTNSQGVLSLSMPRDKTSVVSIQQNGNRRSNIVFPMFYNIIQPSTEQGLDKNIYFPAVKKYLIEGFIYFDQNDNHIREASEPVAQKLKVNISGTDINSYSGSDGYFKMNSWKKIKDIESAIAISSNQEFNDQDTENMRIDVIDNK